MSPRALHGLSITMTTLGCDVSKFVNYLIYTNYSLMIEEGYSSLFLSFLHSASLPFHPYFFLKFSLYVFSAVAVAFQLLSGNVVLPLMLRGGFLGIGLAYCWLR